MFEDDLDIDFDVLSYSQSNSSNLKRQIAEQLIEIEEPTKKSKISPLTDCISSNNPSSSHDLSSTDSSLLPGFTNASNEIKKKFHFKKATKTSPVGLNIQNQKSPHVNTSGVIISDSIILNENRTNSEITKINKLQNHNFLNASSDKIFLEKNRSKVNTTKRRFPGPAGVLPERCFENFNIEEDKASSEAKEEICSQNTCLVLNEGPWQKMRLEFLPKSPEEIYLPDKYNIQWIKSRATMKKLINQKAPFLAAFVHSINSHSIQNPIVNLILKDKTGTIQGTILHNLYEEYSNELVVGSVIVLKELGVISAGSRNEPYLTITSNNLISIYTTARKVGTTGDICHRKQSKIIVQNISPSKLCSNIYESKRIHQRDIENLNNIQKTPSFNDTALKPLNICDNFNKAVCNLNRKQVNGQLQPNLNNLRTNFSDKNKPNTNHETFKTSFIDQDTLKFVHQNTTIKPSKVSNNTENITELMDLFNTQEGLDEFFNEEPIFCSTQRNCNDAAQQSITENSDMTTKIDCNKKYSNGTLLKDKEKENQLVLQDMLEGLDTDALFNDF